MHILVITGGECLDPGARRPSADHPPATSRLDSHCGPREAGYWREELRGDGTPRVHRTCSSIVTLRSDSSTNSLGTFLYTLSAVSSTEYPALLCGVCSVRGQESPHSTVPHHPAVPPVPPRPLASSQQPQRFQSHLPSKSESTLPRYGSVNISCGDLPCGAQCVRANLISA